MLSGFNLEHLDISNNSIYKVGLLATAIAVNGSLLTINMRNNCLQVREGVILKENVKHNRTLVKVCLEGNSVSMRDIEDINKQCRANRKRGGQRMKPKFR